MASSCVNFGGRRSGGTVGPQQQVINKELHPACSPKLSTIPALSQKIPSGPTGKAEVRDTQLFCLSSNRRFQRGHFRHFPRKGWSACPTRESQNGVSHKARACGLREAAQKRQCFALTPSWPGSCGIFLETSRERFKEQDSSAQTLVYNRTQGAWTM